MKSTWSYRKSEESSHNHCGFTLIELMVGLACMIGALSVMLSFSMTLYHSWRGTAQHVQQQVALYAALDVVRRDLEHAPCDAAQWYVVSPHEVVWHEKASSGDRRSPDLRSRDLRMCVVKNNLERCEGIYDTHSHTWHTRSVSVLMTDVKELRIALLSNQVGRYSAADVEVLTNAGLQERALVALGIGALS